MNKAKAIHELEDAKDGYTEYLSNDAIDMAIEALKAEPCEDAVSRQAVIDLLKEMRKDGNMVPWEGKNVFARIRKLPSVQPEPNEGHWSVRSVE